MSSIGVSVVGGLHDGAIVRLVEGVPRRLGSGADVDILLVDEAVAEHQCSLLWNGGDVVEVEAIGAGMAVYGKALDVGGRLALPIGAVVSISTLSLLVVRLEAVSCNEDQLGVQAPSETETSTARRRVLRQLHWLLYARDVLRPGKTTCWAAGGIVAAAVVSSWTVHLLGSAPSPQHLAEASAARIHALFPAVKVHASADVAAIHYDGYVRDQRELNQLRSIALGAGGAPAVLRVVPMDVLQFNASMWLESYYQEARVESVAPGELKITVGSGAAIRELEGWDFSGVGRQLMRELPELSSVSVVLADVKGEEIPVPAAQVGMSFLPTSEGSVYVVGKDGAALFTGAVTPDGRIDSIGNCGLLLHSRNSASSFRLSSGKTGCGDIKIAPGAAGPRVDSGRDNTSP